MPEIPPVAMKVAKAPVYLLNPRFWYQAFIWFSVFMLVWFVLGSSILTIMNIRENGLSRQSLNPLWSDMIVPLMGGGTQWYYAAQEIIANEGHIPIDKPELVLSGKDGMNKLYDYLNLIKYKIIVVWLYIAYFLKIIVAPFLFPFWMMRGLYKYQKTHNWELDALKITIGTYLIILIIGGQISLYGVEEQLTGKQAVIYEYRSIIGYYLFPVVLFGGDFQSGYENFVLPKVRAEQNLGGASNGTLS